MTRDGIRANFYRIGVQAGIGPLQPHSLRRTFATLSLKAGAPSRLVQVAGGWASLSMVEKYSRALKPADFDGFFPVDRLMGITGRDDLSS
jgi:integrase